MVSEALRDRVLRDSLFSVCRQRPLESFLVTSPAPNVSFSPCHGYRLPFSKGPPEEGSDTGAFGTPLSHALREPPPGGRPASTPLFDATLFPPLHVQKEGSKAMVFLPANPPWPASFRGNEEAFCVFAPFLPKWALYGPANNGFHPSRPFPMIRMKRIFLRLLPFRVPRPLFFTQRCENPK